MILLPPALLISWLFFTWSSFIFSREWSIAGTGGDLSTSVLLNIKIPYFFQDTSELQIAGRWKNILGKSLCAYPSSICPAHLFWLLSDTGYQGGWTFVPILKNICPYIGHIHLPLCFYWGASVSFLLVELFLTQSTQQS